MFLLDGKNSTVLDLVVGTGGVTAGDLCVLSSGTAIRAAATITAATIIGIALKSAAATAMTSFDLCLDRVVRSVYTGTATPVTNAVYDVSDATTVNSDDTTGGSCYCVDVDAINKTIDFIVTLAQRKI